MPFIQDFEEFLNQAEALYRSNPLRTRYTTKYDHKKGKMTLQVTDDQKCVQFKTDQQVDLKKVERFNSTMVKLMVQGGVPSITFDD